MSFKPQQKIENRLLTALCAEDYERLIPHLELVKLSHQQILYDSGELIEHVYFPNQALVSLVSIMENGDIVEVGLVTKQGMVGMPVCWGQLHNYNRDGADSRHCHKESDFFRGRWVTIKQGF